MRWNERRKRRWASPFFGLTDEYKIQLHELIYDMANSNLGGLGYDAVYTMPVHYRSFYVRKLSKDKEKEKQAYEKAQGLKEGSPSIQKGPAIKR